MGIMKRVKDIFSAEAHDAVDKAEDPVKMTKLGIRQLKEKQVKAQRGLAKAKAAVRNTQRDVDAANDKAKSMLEKAQKLQAEAKAGDIEQARADELSKKALAEKKTQTQKAARLQKVLDQQTAQANQLETTLNTITTTIRDLEDQQGLLESRAAAAETSREVQEELSDLDPDSVQSMLKRMQEKVESDEDIAASYADMAEANMSVDDEIDAALADAADSDIEDELAALKAES